MFEFFQTILKVVKEHVVSLSKHKTAYRLLITIFDAVDDTVLVKKAIISTLASNVKDVAKDHWGKMVRFISHYIVLYSRLRICYSNMLP